MLVIVAIVIIFIKGRFFNKRQSSPEQQLSSFRKTENSYDDNEDGYGNEYYSEPYFEAHPTYEDSENYVDNGYNLSPKLSKAKKVSNEKILKPNEPYYLTICPEEDSNNNGYEYMAHQQQNMLNIFYERGKGDTV